MATEKITSYTPEQVLADDNSRFSLKQSRIDALAADILEAGAVLVPVEVAPLDPPINGHLVKLTSGFYRHAAVLKLNAEGAGLALPAIVREVDPKTRLMHQLSENMQRENQSPMDQAVAIKKLFDTGATRQDVRRLFARPGGKKGTQIQPASNAWVNIIVSLLDLPKSIQERIHDGRVGIAAAYELGKVSPEKRQAVLDRAESDRLRFAEQEERDEERFLQAESRANEASAKADEAKSEIETLREGVNTAEHTTKSAVQAFREVQKRDYLNASAEEKKQIKKDLEEREGEVKAAQRAEKDIKNKLAKATEAARKANDSAAEAKQRLEEARRAKKPAKKAQPISPDEVKRAAAEEGEGSQFVPLNASEMRACVREIAEADATQYPTTIAIGAQLADCFAGRLTTQGCIAAIGELVKDPGKPAKKAAKAAKK